MTLSFSVWRSASQGFDRSPSRGLHRVVTFLARAAQLLTAVLLIPVTQAQPTGTGTVTGQVLDTSSGKYLEGAEVSIVGTQLRTTTSREGRFLLGNVPIGSQSVVVSYLGLETQTVPVNVDAGQNVPVAVRLVSDVVQLNTFTVTTMREGMAQAVALQKVSVQYKVVAAADQFGPVSEGNIGEYLKFLPGVTIDYNVNDARGISLRGLSTAFTIVAVDGTPMAGTSSIDDTRRFEFEQIAMNNVETTELFKSVSPDLPASATGGFVNFVTKSAFDHEEAQIIEYDLSLSAPSTNLSASKQGGVWGHQKEFTARPSFEVNVARKFNDKLGLNVNYRLSEKYDDSPRQVWAFNQTAGTATVPGITVNPRLQTYTIQSEQKLTHRESFATKLDYRISDSTKLFITGQWNWYDLNFTQRGPSFALGAAAVHNSDDSYTSATGATITNGVLYRNKYGTTIHFNGTLSHEFQNGSRFELTPYWSRANGQYRDTTKGFISTNSTIATGATTFTNFTLSNVLNRGNNPGITLTRGSTSLPVDYIRDLSNYTLANTTGNGLQSRPWTAIDEKSGVSGNYTHSLKQLPMPTTIEVGFAIDKTDRLIDRPDLRYTIGATTGAALQALQDPLYHKDVAFGFGTIQAIDPFKSWDLAKNNAVFLSTYDTRLIHEKNDAVFLRGDVNLTRDLLFTGGFRWEKREIDATARTGASVRNLQTKTTLGYDHYYPSAQLKFTPKAMKALVVRTGYSRTIGHPDYLDILPVISTESAVGAGDGSLSVPTANLQPYFTKNYDLSIDYYLKNSGVVGLSLFRKDVSNFIVTRTMTAAERTEYAALYGLNSAAFGPTATGAIRENGANTRLTGLEVSYAQNLTFLPKPFDGFNLQANFTYIDIDASDPNRFKAIDAEYAQSRAVSPKTANFIVGYRYQKLSLTATTNWVDDSLFGGFVATSAILAPAGSTNTTNPFLDTRLALYRSEKTTTDFKIQYAFNRRVNVYFLVRNVFNSRRDDYAQGYLPENKGLVLPRTTYEFGEPHLTVGVKGTF
ncbi:MAG: TonB-dependent receptor [Opitutus sp.]